MSTPDITNTDAAQQELREIALLLKEYADAEEISIKELIEIYPALGSDKTFGTIRTAKWSEIKAENWLDAYRSVMTSLTETGEADPLYADLSSTKVVSNFIIRLKLSRTLAKLVIVKGFTGSGKTSALRVIRDRYNEMSAIRQVYDLQASEGWGDSPTVMLGELLSVLGYEPGPANKSKREKRLIEALGQRNIMISLDECHDLGPSCLRELKTLLNRTAVKIVIACHPRLWRELESAAQDDLSQLTGNRLIGVVDLGTLTVEDVELLIKRRLAGSGLTTEIPAVAKIIAEAALGYGNLAFVREVIIRLQKAAKRQPLNLAAVNTAVRKERTARKPERAAA